MIFEPPSRDPAYANAQALAELAQHAGISVPPLLDALVRSGATAYGPDWSQQWRSLCLTQPPALASCDDFEWMSTEERHRTVHEWLCPEAQGGRRFLPFAQNGAGDAYCLTANGATSPDGAVPAVAWVPHDDEEATVLHGSFDDFVSACLLQAMADVTHQLDEFTEEESIGMTRLDIARVTALMPLDSARWLQALAAQAPAHYTVQDGPKARPRDALALISPQQHAAALERLQPSPSEPLRFAVVPRWEVRSSTVEAPGNRSPAPPAAPPTWRSLAADPATRRQAIRAYQIEHGVDLLAAKAAVDAWDGAEG